MRRICVRSLVRAFPGAGVDLKDRGFIKSRAPCKLTGCEDDFSRCGNPGALLLKR